MNLAILATTVPERALWFKKESLKERNFI